MGHTCARETEQKPVNIQIKRSKTTSGVNDCFTLKIINPNSNHRVLQLACEMKRKRHDMFAFQLFLGV